MKKRYFCILTAATALFFATSCNHLDIPGMVINRSDTEERVNDWIDYNVQNGEPIIENAPDNYLVYSSSDSHFNVADSAIVQTDDDRLFQFITAERNDPQAVFSMLVGDLANENGEMPYKIVEASMQYDAESQAKNDPCFPTIGNHDVYFDCAKWYKEHFHTSTYTVTVKTVGGFKDLFVFLDSGNGTHGKRQMDWLEEKLSHRDEYRNCVVISHCWLFRTSYNYTTTPAANLPLDEQYAFMDLMSRSNVSLVVMGHFHMREHREFNGITYVMTDNLNEGTLKPSYMVLSCGDKVSYEYRELASSAL